MEMGAVRCGRARALFFKFAKYVVLDFTGNLEAYSAVCALGRPQRTALISIFVHFFQNSAITIIAEYIFSKV